MKQPAAAILLDADEVLVNPFAPDTLVETIRERLERRTTPARAVENVSNINKQEAPSTVPPSNFAEVAKQAKAKRAKLDAATAAREAKRVKDEVEEKRKRNDGGLPKPRPPS
jgi:DNA-binding response OmpR family regulator